MPDHGFCGKGCIVHTNVGTSVRKGDEYFSDAIRREKILILHTDLHFHILIGKSWKGIRPKCLKNTSSILINEMVSESYYDIARVLKIFRPPFDTQQMDLEDTVPPESRFPITACIRPWCFVLIEHFNFQGIIGSCISNKRDLGEKITGKSIMLCEVIKA